MIAYQLCIHVYNILFITTIYDFVRYTAMEILESLVHTDAGRRDKLDNTTVRLDGQYL